MPIAPQDRRIDLLRALRVSAPMLRMAEGALPHDALRACCSGPPYYAYHGARAPAGAEFIPLWDHGDTVFGVRGLDDGLEFVRYSIETPDDCERIATTEQGFWAAQFDAVYELDCSIEAMEQAAAAVGYRFLSQQLEAREAYEDEPGGYDGHARWLRELVAQIDASQVP